MSSRDNCPAQSELQCQFLEWDSAFFGFNIAQLSAHQLASDQLGSVESWCSTHSIDCLYLLCDAHDDISIRTATRHDFRLVDERLTLLCDLQHASTNAITIDDACIRQWRPDDLPALKRIASISHHDSRFYHDLNFPRARCDALYETWIEKSCHGYADAVLAAEYQSQPVGFLTCRRLNAQEGQIGLLAVDPAARGNGCGRSLLRGALRWFANEGLARVTVATQRRNARAQRLYEQQGFVSHAAQCWFHRWFHSVPARVSA